MRSSRAFVSAFCPDRSSFGEWGFGTRLAPPIGRSDVLEIAAAGRTLFTGRSGPVVSGLEGLADAMILCEDGAADDPSNKALGLVLLLISVAREVTAR